MKKSESIRQRIEKAKAEYEAQAQRMVYQVPRKSVEEHEALWEIFYRSCGSQLRDQIRALEAELHKELNREIEVGDGVTMYLYTDAQACTVIGRTEKTLTIQRDKVVRSPEFKPEWVPGGFSAICTNNEEQKWDCQPNPDGEIVKCRWSEKKGRWQTGSDGSIGIGRGRHEHYDYNF